MNPHLLATTPLEADLRTCTHATPRHTAQEKFADAARYYQPLVLAQADNLLDLPAVVLANLCVCYIMTSQVLGRGWWEVSCT